MLIPLEGLDIVLSVVAVIYNFFCHTLKDIFVQMYEKIMKYRAIWFFRILFIILPDILIPK